MKKSDVQCSDCSAGYRRIELVSRDKRDEIAARQAWLLSEHLGPREKKLRVIDVREMFVEMRDGA